MSAPRWRTPLLRLLPLMLPAVLLGPLPARSAAATPPSASVVTAGPEVGAERSVPGYALPTRRSARVSVGSGPIDTVFQVPTAVGATSLSGDWNHDGAQTPGTYLAGTWTLWDTAVGRAPAASKVIEGFGSATDQPVVGDWNGDGRTDIGVFSNGVFTLATLSTGPTPGHHLHVTYGLAGDVAVVGDWDGNGTDDVGVRRGATFYLRTPAPVAPVPPVAPVATASPTVGTSPRATATSGTGASRAALASPRATASPSPGTPGTPVKPVKPVPVPGIRLGDATIAYGSAADYPVVGDWDSDGKDTIGVVRDSTWLLRDDLLPGPSTRTLNVTREAGAVPLPWRSHAGDGSSCPYVAARTVGLRQDDNAAYVTAPYGLHQPMPGLDVEGKVQLSLLTAERYLMNTGHTSQTYVRQPYSDVLQRTSRTVEEAVRLPAMRAATLAIGLTTQSWDEPTMGTTTRGAQYVGWLVRTIACTHASFTPGGWGYTFQTAHWAMLTAMAAWLVWDTLKPQEREYVATMLVAESDYLLTQPVLYQYDRSGAELSAGDTKAEEDSWNAAALQLAVAMMPDHPRAPLWRRTAVDLAAAAFARPIDLTDNTLVNGTPLASRLAGTNAAADGSVVNNSIVTGDYISTVQQNWWSAAFTRLGQTDVLEAPFTDADAVWAAMTANPYTRTDADGTVTTSTIYRSDGQIFFPQGSRWGTVRRAQFASLDAFRLLTVRNPAGREEAYAWLDQHIDGQLALQARNPDGRTFLPGEDNYPGREEYAASQVAFAWLALYVDAWMPITRVDRGAYAPLPVQVAQPLQRAISPLALLRRDGVAGMVTAVGPVVGDPPHATP